MAAAIDAAVAALKRGGVIAYPTEAVWGLGCDPRNEAAVKRLFALKRRPSAVGVLLIGANFAQLVDYIGAAPESAIERAAATWPGPNTWIFPRNSTVPIWIVGEHAGIALRVTAHPIAAELCRLLGSALVSTSANQHGSPPARSAAEVRAAFGDELDFVLEGELGGLERPTPIRDAITGEIMRY
jgi:L-threonylcarbamoyladenylate synthase